MEGKRMVPSIVLSEYAQALNWLGIETPPFSYSGRKAVYIETIGGIEIYSRGGRVLKVSPGQYIDSFGNMLDLGEFVREALVSPEPEPDEKQDKLIEPLRRAVAESDDKLNDITSEETAGKEK